MYRRLTRLAKTALASLKVNRRRSLLTMLGLIIGIMAVTLVSSIGAGAQSLITNEIRKRGTDLIGVLAGASDEKGPPAAVLGIVITTLTYDDGLALMDKNNVHHLKNLAAYISGNDVVSWKGQEESLTYTGTTPSYPEVEKVTMKSGRFFSDSEMGNQDAVAVIGSGIAEDLFGNQDPIGETIGIKKKKFKVIGVLAPIGSSGFENPDKSVLLPLTTVQRELLGVHHVAFMRMRVDNEAYLDQTVEEITQTLKERHRDLDFSVRKVAELLNVLGTVTDVLKFFLTAIAGVSLFVGGVGIMNIMLIAVKEKTREIGLRKAVGATGGDIRNQFLAETIALSLIGGIIGIIIGTMVSGIVAVVVRSLGYEYIWSISPFAMFVAVLISAGIGLIFGLLPAKRASHLSPIEALRYE
jgi:putative ABC transport system permease protein